MVKWVLNEKMTHLILLDRNNQIIFHHAGVFTAVNLQTAMQQLDRRR
jgi:hypothetical protein